MCTIRYKSNSVFADVGESTGTLMKTIRSIGQQKLHTFMQNRMCCIAFHCSKKKMVRYRS
ncbi:hypothetical protein BLOT_011934 [Blomia tropicalis]|nr:hypothetical protein BLOT_011934 [Blomia tropicalis]